MRCKQRRIVTDNEKDSIGSAPAEEVVWCNGTVGPEHFGCGMTYPTGLYIYHTWKSLTIRTTGDPMRLIAPLQKVLAEVDKTQALFDAQTLEQSISASIGFNRFQMNLFSILGGLRLVLSAAGIYGVMSYLVAQRTHEIGVRVALGARPRDVLWMVIRRG
jgi:hypothetical protein